MEVDTSHMSFLAFQFEAMNFSLKHEQLKEIVGLVGEPSEVLARTVGDGVRKMMKKREEEKR